MTNHKQPEHALHCNNHEWIHSKLF